tara:strand:+ start:828 stop:1019 length:192 start_codon:yes stop_codon:yes gene_type:complete
MREIGILEVEVILYREDLSLMFELLLEIIIFYGDIQIHLDLILQGVISDDIEIINYNGIGAVE